MPSDGGKPPRNQMQSAASIILTLAYKEPPLSYSPSHPDIGLTFQDTNLPINTTFDVLGWLLSVTSQPLPNATAVDFYLPLVALYARWCRVLAGPDVKLAPPMVHIAWFQDAQRSTAVLLGSTIGKVPAPLKIVNVIGERQRELELVRLTAAKPGQQAQTSGNTVPSPGGTQYVLALGTSADGKFTPSKDPALPPRGTADHIEQGFGQCAETFFYLVARK